MWRMKDHGHCLSSLLQTCEEDRIKEKYFDLRVLFQFEFELNLI